MSRADQFRITVEDTAGTPFSDYGPRVWLLMTPASNSPLPTTPIIHDYSWKVYMGTSMTTTGGWKGKVIGCPGEGGFKFKLDLSQMIGSAAIEASRAYWVNPRFEEGGLLTIGGHQRYLDTYNVIEIYGDDGTGDEPSRLLGIYVQVPQAERAFEVDAGGTVELEVECVDAITWLLQNTLPADVGAYAILNAGVLADSGHRGCRNTIYSGSGRTYSHAHGDHPEHWATGMNPRREFTFYPLTWVYQALGETVNLVAQLLLRKVATIFTVSGSTPAAFWSFFAPDWTEDYEHNPAAPVSAPSVLGRVILAASQTVTVGGFFYAGKNATRDQIGSWDNMLAFLNDTTEGLVGKVTHTLTSVSIVNAPTLTVVFRAVKATTGTALAFTPADFLSIPKLSLGKETVTGATATVPGGISRDQPRMVVGRPDSDKMYSLPRSWHTLPTTWPEGERAYEVDANEFTECHVWTPGVNCLTLWFSTNAGGLLPSNEYVRIHHHVSMTDGILTWADESGARTLPTPAGNAVTNFTSMPKTGDTAFGQRLIEKYLEIQLEASTPIVAATVINAIYGRAALPEYEGSVDLLQVDARQLGNRCDPTGFPSGNALLNGDDYLGDIPGQPTVASGEFDWLAGRAKVRMEGI